MTDENDDNPFDQDELRDAFGSPEDDVTHLTPEEVFSLVMINKKRMVKTRVELRDEHGETIELHEVITDLLEFMKNKLKSEEENQFADQIFPMMGQALVAGLGRLIGNDITAFYLGNDIARMSFIHMMSMSFLILKYVQDKKLTIMAIDEPIEQSEIDSVQRKSKANSIAMMGAVTGMSYKDILRELVDKGELTEDDLQEILGGKDKNNDDPGKLQ